MLWGLDLGFVGVGFGQDAGDVGELGDDVSDLLLGHARARFRLPG
jgi:hypothetical protein